VGSDDLFHKRKARMARDLARKGMRYLKNIHPGEVLREEFLIPMGISVYRLSKETGLSQTRLSQIIKGEKSITAETAVKLGKFFGVAPEFWMSLQSLHDIEERTFDFQSSRHGHKMQHRPCLTITASFHSICLMKKQDVQCLTVPGNNTTLSFRLPSGYSGKTYWFPSGKTSAQTGHILLI
jgi:addiction module HigA family antidote